MVQFHPTGASPEEGRRQCEQILAAHHSKLWDYDWLWQAWLRKDFAASKNDAL
jgi:hypothetical protein